MDFLGSKLLFICLILLHFPAFWSVSNLTYQELLSCWALFQVARKLLLIRSFLNPNNIHLYKTVCDLTKKYFPSMPFRHKRDKLHYSVSFIIVLSFEGHSSCHFLTAVLLHWRLLNTSHMTTRLMFSVLELCYGNY